MATVPVIKTVFSGNNKLVVNITGVFDTADASAYVVVDRSTLTGPDQVNPPTYIRVDELTWSVGVNFDEVTLSFDDATDEVIERLQGQGYMDYRPYGGKKMAGAPTTATEGDIVLDTVGGSANGNFSILLVCTLKP